MPASLKFPAIGPTAKSIISAISNVPHSITVAIKAAESMERMAGSSTFQRNFNEYRNKFRCWSVFGAGNDKKTNNSICQLP